MPKVAELRTIDGALWARIEIDPRDKTVELLSEGEIAQRHDRDMQRLGTIDRLQAALVRIADDSWDSARDLKEIARAALGQSTIREK